MVRYARSGDELPLPCSARTHTSGCASCMPAGVQSSSNRELLESWWLLQPLLQPLALAQESRLSARDHPALSNTLRGRPVQVLLPPPGLCWRPSSCPRKPRTTRATGLHVCAVRYMLPGGMFLLRSPCARSRPLRAHTPAQRRASRSSRQLCIGVYPHLPGVLTNGVRGTAPLRWRWWRRPVGAAAGMAAGQ